VFNAANEVAVSAFLAGTIRFGRIAETIRRVLDAHQVEPIHELATVRAADQWARDQAREALA
jgi:1-deoxy-D-xylulose-5-phosphate reductoisomerase